MGRGYGLALVVALMAAETARADELKPPQNVNAEPGNRQSSQLASRAATADVKGQPRQALDLANQAIRADPRNPWPYYDKGMALAELGETDGALAALYAAEQRFVPSDRWAKSVAIYGRAQTLNRAGRCVEAVQAYADYAQFVAKDDPRSADMARRYAVNCQTPGARGAAPAAAPAPAPAPATTPPGVTPPATTTPPASNR
jgi:tetratricopeptide (TPR) repeat protein